MIACKRGKLNTAKVLLEQVADINKINEVS